MKRKMLNLTLSLILVFSLAAVVAPAGAAKVQAAGLGDGVVSLGYDDYNLADFDIRYVAKHANSLLDLNGDPYTHVAGSDAFGGSLDMPWGSIQHAIDELPYDPGPGDKKDMIIVGPSDVTGPDYTSAYPESLLIPGAKVPIELVIVSVEGAETTIINGSEECVECGVVEINASNVTIDGFKITSTDGPGTGICANPDVICAASGGGGEPPCCGEYLQNVKVLNSHIKIDQSMEGTGIFMSCVKYPVIDGCEIDVGTEGGEALSVESAWGIVMFYCFLSQITNNELDVKGAYYAVGISMEGCPKSLVGVLPPGGDTGAEAPNDIEVNAGGDVMAWGIWVLDSDLIDIMYNTVSVLAVGCCYVSGYGIEVISSDRSDVIDNTVTVVADEDDDLGFLLARGIRMSGCIGPNNVNLNHVMVMATGYENTDTVCGEDFTLDESIVEDMAELEPILNQSLGIDQSCAAGMASVVGISISGSPGTAVIGNDPVDVTLGVEVISGDDLFAAGYGGGCAIGISGLGSPGINVNSNMVTVWDDVYAQVSSTTEEVGGGEFAFGGAQSVALGIILDNCPGGVTGNSVNADADVEAVVLSGVFPADIEVDSLLSRLDAEIIDALYMQLEETLGEEALDVALSGDLPGIQSLGMSAAMATGIGIMVMNSQTVMVAGNNPVSGTGDATVLIDSRENDEHPALASGGGIGLGLGIVILDTRGATVSGNQGVNGSGTVAADISALHKPVVPTNAHATGGGAGIGMGILLCGMPGYQTEAEQMPEGQCWPDRPVVELNGITAYGEAGNFDEIDGGPIMVQAADENVCHEACACGQGLALAAGIAALWYPGILIQGNVADADALAVVHVESEAVHEFDPASYGGAVAIGVGIGTVGCWFSEILNNQVTGDAVADSEVGATEHVFYTMSANAFGGSLALGGGVVVIDCPFSLVSGNSVAIGRGDANCVVTAMTYIPLSSAYTYGLSVGMGTGIMVAYSPFTDVVRCNTADGEGSARVSAIPEADFDDTDECGFAGSYDIVMKLSCVPFGFEEEADGLCTLFGKVNYNSIGIDETDPTGDPIGATTVSNTDDYGLLKIGWFCLDATMNWWNDPTGPMPIGNGEEVKSLYGCPVKFVPWLYVVHTDVLDNQIGKFGFFLPTCKGLNTISTPIALEKREGVVPTPYRPSWLWADIAENSGWEPGVLDILYLEKWIPGEGWVSVDWYGTTPRTDDDSLDPLDAWYIYFVSPGERAILFVNSDMNNPSMPQKELSAGWNLVGPNPLFPEPSMPADDVLKSVEKAGGGLPGYVQVVSPLVNGTCQPYWYYTAGEEDDAPDMLSGKGYWVWMEINDTLAGVGFSPIWTGP